ncbi:MAG: dethiobiotin synthase [Spongiibacteraceae bacterium]|nr:dethiobiotin synthase [Spongiibacteraceae bacterium]
MASNKFFITGTDTDVGKTLFAAGLLTAANNQQLSTVAIKPLAAGCQQTPDGLRNDDALLLQACSSIALPYSQVNPVALEPAVAPHIAAAQEGRRLRVAQLAGYCQALLMQRADLALVEGAGGWRVPINSSETLADLSKELNIPVILVVGVKLGCINHALLTMQAIANDGLTLHGWVANRISADMPCYQENIATLRSMITAPCLAEVPYLEDPLPETVANFINMDLVISGQNL